MEEQKGDDNVTERLQRRERKYQRLLIQLPDPVLVLQHDHVVFANRAAAALLGAESPAQLRGRAYSDFLLSTLPPSEGHAERQELRRMDGVVVDVEVVRADVGSSHTLVLRDVAQRDLAAFTLDRLHNDEQIRQSQRMEAVGRLASGIAHDFNNLLTAIHGHAQFLIDDLPADHASRSDAEEVLRSAERATLLTRQLLAFSRGQAPQVKTIDLNHVVTSIERLLRRVISENISLVAALDPALKPVNADPSQIEQVLVNLIVNARDAMPDGGTISIRTANIELDQSYTEIRTDVQSGPHVMLSVTDTGVGMAKEIKEHIFEPFFTTKPEGHGTGLGLSTVYGIVKHSGGHIFVYSEPRQGTTFKIYLPAVAAGPQRESPAYLARNGETVLVVEDDTSVRALAKRVLDARGYNVLQAGTGDEALAVLARDEDITLVVTDVMLPDTTGLVLAESIQERYPACRIILMSGYTSEDVRKQGAFGLNVGFVEKPFSPDTFAKTVREILDSAR